MVVCTDGIPNVGIGSLEDGASQKAAAVYELAGERAAEHHVAVSMIGVQGAGGALGHLATCARITAGTVTIAEPLELIRELRKVSQVKTIATNATLRVLLHPTMVRTLRADALRRR